MGISFILNIYVCVIYDQVLFIQMMSYTHTRLEESEWKLCKDVSCATTEPLSEVNRQELGEELVEKI